MSVKAKGVENKMCLKIFNIQLLHVLAYRYIGGKFQIYINKSVIWSISNNILTILLGGSQVSQELEVFQETQQEY